MSYTKARILNKIRAFEGCKLSKYGCFCSDSYRGTPDVFFLLVQSSLSSSRARFVIVVLIMMWMIQNDSVTN